MSELKPTRTRALAVAALTALLLWAVTAVTLEQVFARRAPALALRAVPYSAEAQVRLGAAMLAQSPPARVSASVRALATRALLREPVNAEAASLLGLLLASAGREQQANAAIRYAFAMSRRDLPTQLYLIESSVGHGDVQTALTHYDQALRTSPRAADLLFPILSVAASKPEIAGPLAGRLARRPSWGRVFMRRFIPIATSPSALFALARSAGLADRPSLDAGLLEDADRRLVSLRGYREAGRLYAQATGAADPATQSLRNGDFEKAGGGLPFDWNIKDEPDLSATRVPGPRRSAGTALAIQAANGRGGEVASQLMLLTPGRYIVRALVGAVEGDPTAFPQIVIRCDGNDQEVAHAAFPRSPNSGNSWSFTFAVGPACPAQWFVVQAASPLDAPSAQPWIDEITVQRSVP